jgi:hypothetical protein
MRRRMASVRVRHTTTLASGSSNCTSRGCAKTNVALRGQRK